MKDKQTMTLDQLFIKEYLEKKERLENADNKIHSLKKSLVCAMNLVDSYRRMIADLEIEKAGEYINIRGFLDKRDDSFELFETEIEDREKMKKNEEEKVEEKEDDQSEEVTEKEIKEEETNE